MPLVIPNGYAHVAYLLGATGDPEPMSVTVGLELTAIPTAGEVTLIYEAFRDAWIAQLSDEYTFLGLRGRGVSAGGAEYELEAIDSTAGANTSSMLPVNCGALIRKRTGIPGREHRGRCFMPGVLQELEVDNVGNLSPTMQGLLDGCAGTWLTDTEAIAVVDDMVILHTNPATAPSDISALECDPKIATQRRRLR